MLRPRLTASLAVLAIGAASPPALAAGTGETLLVSGLPGLAPPTPDLFAWNISGYGYRDDSDGRSDLSADGNLAVFATEADDLAAGPGDFGPSQVVLKNVATGALTNLTPGANGGSSMPSLSDDGTKVAFASTATNLSPADTTPDPDVFVKDLVSGTVTLISSTADEGCAENTCVTPSISGNGQFVVFTTSVPLVAGDTNTAQDVYRASSLGGGFTLMSARTGTNLASAGGYSHQPSISDNGVFVAFASSATDLVVGDANAQDDIFVRKAGSTTTILASAKTFSTDEANGGARSSEISGDGQYVAFTTTATDVLPAADSDATPDTFRRRVSDGANLLATQASVLISRATGVAGTKADARADVSAISDNGDVVAFTSSATNLGGPGGYQPFVRRVGAATTTPLGSLGAPGFAVAQGLSDDGSQAVLWAYEALVPGAPPHGAYRSPTLGGAPTLLSTRPGAPAAQPILTNSAYEYYASSPQNLSADGRYAVFGTGSPALTGVGPFESGDGRRIFRRDMRTGDVLLVSRKADGTPVPGDRATISADGSRVGFRTPAALVAEDADGKTDAYVLDLRTGTPTLASKGGPADANSDGSTIEVQLSADGRRVLFLTKSSNLGAPGKTHAYVRDLAAGTTAIADRATGEAGAVGNGDVEAASISGDGTKVAFAHDSTNLADDADAVRDVHVRDLATSTTVLATRADGNGAKGDSLSTEPVINGAGTKVAFRSYARNLDATLGLLPAGSPIQAVVRDLGAATTRIASRVGAAGPISNRGVGPLDLSADGALLAFTVNGEKNPGNIAASSPPYADAIAVRNLASGEQQVVAIGAAFDPTNSSSAVGTTAPSLSADGRCLAFSARGTGLVANVSPDFRQQYMRILSGDCQTTVPPGPAPVTGVERPPSTPTTTTAPSTPSATATTPRITKLKLTNRRFRVGSKRTATSAAGRKKAARKKTPVGTTLRFTLNTTSALRVRIEKRTTGRRVGKTCRKATKKLRRRKPCVRYVRVGTLKRASVKRGARRLAFSGRIGKRALKPGRYRFSLVASAGKRTSKTVRATFTVARR